MSALDLDLAGLPDLPQAVTIRWLAPRLWADESVRAIWLGGSLARGEGDAYGDIDLRIAVPAARLAGWETLDFATLFEDQVISRHLVPLRGDQLLHNLTLRNGDVLDFLVQATTATPATEPILMLGCRDDEVARALTASAHMPDESSPPVTPEAVRELVVAFWVNSHKHRKVLHRHLDLMFPAGAYANWAMLMQLWYISATGCEATSRHFSGIHGLTELVQAVEQAEGTRPLELCGLPARTSEEIRAVIERHRDEAARVGRLLAERYGFAYPEDLERTVRASWAQFVADEPMDAAPMGDMNLPACPNSR